MNKNEMAKKLAANTELTQAQAGRVIDKIFDPVHGLVADELGVGGKVAIGGFGTFEVRERAARMGRNPHTGEELAIPAKKYPAFKAAKGLKDRVA